jgi:DNA-directed RNA polymerase specialized sigma24 family protein
MSFSLAAFFRKTLFIFFLSSLGCFASGQESRYSHLLNKTFEERETFLYKFVDSLAKATSTENVLLQLNNAGAWARQKNKQLEYELRLAKYRFRGNVQPFAGKDPQLEKDYLTLINDLEGPEYLKLKLHVMNALSEYYWGKCSEYGHAFEFLLRAYDVYKDLPNNKLPFKSEYIYHFASSYYGFKDYENAKQVLLELNNEERQHAYPEPEIYYNLLGLCYRNLAEYDSAVYYLKAGHRKAVEKKNYIYQAIISGNIGISYYYQKRFAEAIPLLQKDIQYCLENNRATDNATKSLAILGDVYLQQGEVEKALDALTKANDLVRRERYWSRYELLEFVYPITAKIYARKGNSSLAYAFMDSAMKVRDSLTRQKNSLILSGAQNLVSAQKHISEVQKFNDQKRIQVLIRNSLFISVMLLGSLALLFINRQKIINRRKQERLESEKQLVAAELANAGDQLNMFTKSIQEKNSLIEEFTAQLESMQPASVGVMENYEPETLLKLRESTILTDEEWESFRKLFEKVHTGYFDRLKIKIPGLSPAETRFIALTKLQFSNKEMAGILGISTDAVRMNKHRLRKKLNLTEDISIEELVGAL